MRQHAPILVIVLVLLCIFGYFLARSPETLQENLQSEVENMKSVSIATSTPYTIISGEYPQFLEASDDFNNNIRDMITKGMVEHFKASEEAWKARPETAPSDKKIAQFPSQDQKWYFIASSTIVRNDGDIISVVVYLYDYTGGAHGSENIQTFNYDVQKKKLVTLSDIANTDTKFLEKLSTLSKTLLRKDLAERGNMKPEEIDADMLNDGTAPRESNFSVFTLPKNGEVTFYFTQYQVAAYVFGSSKLTLKLPLR